MMADNIGERLVPLSEEIGGLGVEEFPRPPPSMARATVEGRLIAVRTGKGSDFQVELSRCRAIPGGHFERERDNAWVCDASASAAAAIVEIWSRQIAVDGAFMSLLEQHEALIDASLAKKDENPTPVPGELRPSWRHQQRAYHFAEQLPAVMLNMEMGCGKSKVTIELIRTKGWKKCLILCPLAVVGVWPREFELHWPGGADIWRSRKSWSVRRKCEEIERFLAQSSDKPKVVLLNYESAKYKPLGPTWNEATGRRTDDGLLIKTGWDFVGLDESHRIASPGSKVSRFCHQVGRVADNRMCMTGTPMRNGPADVYAQYRFLDSGIFGTSMARFKARYCVMGGFENRQIVGYQNQDEFLQKFDSIAFTARTADVLDLPDSHHIRVDVTLSKAEMDAYKTMARDFVVELKKFKEDTGDNPGIYVDDPENPVQSEYEGRRRVAAPNVLAKLLRLQQICCGFIQDREEGIFERLGDSKERALRELMLDRDPADPVVVGARFIPDLDAIKKVAADVEMEHGEISGRLKTVDGVWEKGDGDLLGVQVRAGGVGINLTRSNTCILYSLGYLSPADYDQFLARTLRPGQERAVTYFHLVATGTIEERVYEALREKKNIIDHLVDQLV